MFTAWYELNIVNMTQVEKLSIVINLCGITVLVWNYGTVAVGGKSSWAISVSHTTKTQTLCRLLNLLSFLSSRVGHYVKF
jgi:hypothetical protein